MSRRRGGDVIVALIVVGALLVVALFMIFGFEGGGMGEASFKPGPKVGLVEVIGPIYDSRSWVDEIDDFRENHSIKAIVIRLDSPGGAVAASQELYEAIKRAREEKPVIASMGNAAASGAYYAALGADSIVANPGTTTGSIGVVMELLVFKDLMEKLGIGSEVVKSGALKDAGNPSRQLTEGERAYFQGYIDDAYAEFVRVVVEEREMPEELVRELADGRVFTGTQALGSGLVDVLGDQYLAVGLAAQMAGIDEQPVIVRPYRTTELDWIDLLLGQALGSAADRARGNATFQYMWNVESTR